MVEKRLIDPSFVKEVPVSGGSTKNGPYVFMFRGYRPVVKKLAPKDARWLDDDVLTPMETAVYGESP